MSAQELQPAVNTGPPIGNALGILVRPLIAAVFGRTVRRGKPYPWLVAKLPNLLTLSRGGFPLYGGIFTWAVLSGHGDWAAVGFVVIVLAYSTDAFDGELARYLGCTSTWGARWDPIFDKLAGLSMLICWGIMLWVYDPGWLALFTLMAVVRVGEDVALAIIAGHESQLGLKPKAGPWGKIKSATDVASVIMACLGGLRYVMGGYGLLFVTAAMVLLLAAICLAPLSIREHWRNLRQK